MKRFFTVFASLIVVTGLVFAAPPLHNVTYNNLTDDEQEWYGYGAKVCASHFSDWERHEARAAAAKARFLTSLSAFDKATVASGRTAYPGDIALVTTFTVVYVLDGEGKPTEAIDTINVQGD